jgi:RimJ/RimL family protein N-acetyltransferase
MLYGERIRFRRDERTDIPRFTEWLNDPDVIRYLGAINLPQSMANEEQWFEAMLKLPREEQPFAIEIRESDGTEDAWRLIGNCSFMNIDQTVRSAEVGLFIGDKTHWNQGYGTEVMRLLLQVGFNIMNLNRIFLRVDVDNKGGVRAYEKAGFILEGRLRQAAFQDGQYRDMLLMSVLRSEWTLHSQVDK